MTKLILAKLALCGLIVTIAPIPSTGYAFG